MLGTRMGCWSSDQRSHQVLRPIIPPCGLKGGWAKRRPPPPHAAGLVLNPDPPPNLQPLRFPLSLLDGECPCEASIRTTATPPLPPLQRGPLCNCRGTPSHFLFRGPSQVFSQLISAPSAGAGERCAQAQSAQRPGDRVRTGGVERVSLWLKNSTLLSARRCNHRGLFSWLSGS